MSEIICQFCEKNTTSEKVTLFNEHSLRKCREVLQIRVNRNLKYSNIELPNNVDNCHGGYHLSCYKKFTAVKCNLTCKIKRTQITQDSSLQEIIPTESILPSTSKDSDSAKNYTLPSVCTDLPKDPAQAKLPVPSVCTDLTKDPAQAKLPVPSVCTDLTKDLAQAKLLVPSICTDLTKDPAQAKLPDSGAEFDLNTVCIFCNRERKQIKKQLNRLHKLESNEVRRNICIVALELGEIDLHDKVNYTKNLFYHSCCLKTFLKKTSSSLSLDNQSHEETTDWHITRQSHKIAFENLEELLKKDVLLENQVYLMSTLHEKYISNLSSSVDDDVPVIKSLRLEGKILEEFGEQITIQVIKGLKLVFKTGTLMSVLETHQEEFVKRDILRSAANILRNEILSLPVTPLPINCSVADLLKGECGIPNALKEFNINLLGGDNERRVSSEVTVKKAESISQDQIYAVTNGRTKPSKQLTLGMAVKSLTNSKKVINILNKYGQSASYTLLEELETEMTYTAMNDSATTLIPPGIIPCSHLNTGVAYDNFDRYVETATGKDTLHDTVGIIFQNEKRICQPEQNTQNVPVDLTKKKHEGGRRRRAFDNIDTNIVHPSKKPKMVDQLISIDSELRELPESVAVNAKKRDLLWLLCHAADIENFPMWVGFNNLTMIDESLKQNIAYLNPINISPTNASIVKTTMENAKQIAEECHQEYICVTYDLAIAKVALQIQSVERPYFDNLFIFLGPFHINMAYFKAIGKVIIDCGLTHIMVEAELLASGSVNGFVSGTHFNRCKRLHPIVSLALQLLHFRYFLKEENTQLTPDLVEELKEIIQRKISSSENILADVDNPSLSEIINKYEQFQKMTLDGAHGKTAQFYMTYINLIEYYFLLSRSIRENHFELYKYVLPKIANVFFILNHPNYARWLTKHHDDLIKLQDTHPRLKQQLEHGGLGIKRTNKAFSRQPVDLTLEQTVNADAAKRLSGISHFTNSISGRQRWAKSHALRSTVVTHVLNETKISSNQDVSSELEKSNIKKNKIAVQKLLETIECYGNPFDYQGSKDELFNLVTAKSVKKETADFLLNLETAGESQRKNFISECNEDCDRFEKPIKQNKLKNFAAEKSKPQSKIGQKFESVKIQRGLFGRLLGISLNKQLDLAKVLEFPLTPTPSSMTHTDGTMMKTNKSSLMKILEKEAVTDLPQKNDVLVIDGFYFLHLLPDFPKTFGELSFYILKKMNAYKAQRIDIIFDSYITPSIKDLERDARQADVNTTSQYKITGPKQVRPQNFIQELRNSQFKEELVQFLIRHWASEGAAAYISGKTLNLNFENHCFSYESDGMSVLRTDNNDLKCGDHEETDTKIIYHIHRVQEPSNIIVKSSDTDVMIILLGNFEKVETHQIYMETGTIAKRRIIHINKIYYRIGKNLARSLPAFHALTGCDYIPAFHRKGKKRPYNILAKHKEYQDALIELSDDKPLSNTTTNKIEQYVCDLYGCRSNSVNDARHKMFLKKFKPNKENEKFDKSLTNFDASSMPPAKTEFDQQILRTRYVSNIWSNAHKETPSTLSPINHGWEEKNGKYVPVWYHGNQLPSSVVDVTVTNETQEINSDSSVCIDSDDNDF